MQPSRTFSSEAEKWEAVRRRDALADEHFLFAVKTTGVYCWPSCAARLPRRENVVFHASRADAERAGFRPCKRCRPDLPPRAERESALVAAACRAIESAEEPPRLSELASHAGVSAYHFHRMFKRIAGVTPKAYAAAQRANRVQDSLRSGSEVTEAMYAAGFNSSGRFYEAAPEILGMKPSAYRNGGKGEAMRYAVKKCSLGRVLVAATERGLCAILLGDSAAQLGEDLKARFPGATLNKPSPGFADWVDQVVRFVDNPRAGELGLPLDVRGTAFQRKVWEALREIPPGKTRTYAAVAERVGSRRAARAVAAACAANPLAVAIPCHRVVASSGDLAGYRWGVERKRRLLDQEHE
ncbi:MAG: bifunctional DNA-binding transcriptional regulator/O6-methylguanine-DNA methyltransferase Ada [Bryobacterales bacterium]